MKWIEFISDELTYEIDRIHIIGKGSYLIHVPSEGNLLFELWVILLYSRLISAYQQCRITSSESVLIIERAKNLTAITQLSNLNLKVFSRQLRMDTMQYEDGMLKCRPELDSLWSHCKSVSNFL